MTRTKTIGVAALSVSALLALSACNPAANQAQPGGTGGGGTPAASGAASGTFSKQLAGELKTSGFNPGDEVGKSRGDYATEKLNPVKVTMDTTNFDAQKFAAQSASGQVPDLIQVDRSGIGTLADKGLIIPMDECYTLWGVQPTERYYEAAVKDVTYDGKVYAVPQFFQASMIIGNKNVMGPAGVTIDQLDSSKPDQLIEMAKKMAKVSGGKPTVLGFDADLPGSSGTWLAVFGGKPQDEKGKPTLNEPANVEALTWMKKLQDAQGGHAAADSLKQTFDAFGDQNQFVKNQVGAQTMAQWYVNVLANTKDKVKVDAAPLKTKDGKVLGMAGGTSFAIPKAAKNPSAACAFAIQVTSPEAWQKAGEARAQKVQTKGGIVTGLFTGSPVADKAVREAFVKPSGNADFDKLIKTSYDALESTTSFGGSAVGTEIDNALKNAVAQVLGGKDPKAALDEAQATAQRAWDQSAMSKKG